MISTIAERVRGLFSLLWREIMKFGAVGAVCYLIDSGIYLYLLHGPMADKTLTAKVIAGAAATMFSWVANRYWTFRHRRRTAIVREFLLFVVINAIALGAATFCVFISHYVLGLESAASDFIAGNVIGLVLGTTFRFLAYRYWVFSRELSEDPDFADVDAPLLAGRRASRVTGRDAPRTGA